MSKNTGSKMAVFCGVLLVNSVLF